MKHLRIEYNSIVLYDGEVNEVTWSDSDSGIKVEGRMRGSSGGGGGGGGISGFLEAITNASKNRTQEVVEEKRQQLNEEKAQQVLADAEVAVQ